MMRIEKHKLEEEDSRAKVFKERIHFGLTDIRKLSYPICAGSAPQHAQNTKEQQMKWNSVPAADILVTFSGLCNPTSNPTQDMLKEPERDSKTPPKNDRFIRRRVAQAFNISIHHLSPRAL